MVPFAFLPLVFALAIPAPTIVSADVLEPSVENEVEHALSRAPTSRVERLSVPAEAFYRLYETNGLSATARAIELVSAQRADGRWTVGTNDVTEAAVRQLRRLVPDRSEGRNP